MHIRFTFRCMALFMIISEAMYQTSELVNQYWLRAIAVGSGFRMFHVRIV